MTVQTYFNTNERLLVEDLNIKHKKRTGHTETRSLEGNRKHTI